MGAGRQHGAASGVWKAGRNLLRGLHGRCRTEGDLRLDVGYQLHSGEVGVVPAVWDPSQHTDTLTDPALRALHWRQRTTATHP